MLSLKTYLRLNLKKLDKQIALIFYTSKSDRSFSETFLTALSTLSGSIYLISDQKCDNIESISPHHPNLIDNIITVGSTLVRYTSKRARCSHWEHLIFHICTSYTWNLL
ncbi:MAG: hypothetical protein F6K39_13535 [Okeania sp. SIO3B3]|nr:hypothetical protein [Okeania sp. SIO3B3]